MVGLIKAPKGIFNFENFIAMLISQSPHQVLDLELTSVTFVDDLGRPFVFILENGFPHNRTAEKILEQNPHLYIAGTQSLRFKMTLSKQRLIEQIMIKNSRYVSTNLSSKVLRRFSSLALTPKTSGDLFRLTSQKDPVDTSTKF